MIKTIIKSIFGDKASVDRKKYEPFIALTNTFETEVKNDNDDELRARTRKFKAQIADVISPLETEINDLREKSQALDLEVFEKEEIFETIDKKLKEVNELIEKELERILPEAFSVIRETARRWAENGKLTVSAEDFDKELASKKDGISIDGDKAIWHNAWSAAGAPVEWKMVHYDVQLIGGAVLHKGNIAEMQTGEGKTLVATLPVYLNALAAKGVHVVTVNDYLAKRDSEWMGPIYQFHGLSVDCIDKHRPNSAERKKAYRADITFGTNNEFGFDYLRDNMASELDDLVQRAHHFAIVDEVDSVLIDDARTPLIISGPTPKGDQHEFYELKPRIERLVEAQRKFVNQALADAKKLLTVISGEAEAGVDVKKSLEEGGIALLRAHRGLPKNKALIKFLSETGIKTHLLKTENQYLGENGRHMKKIDVELYFTIDEKNNSVDLTDKGIELISGSDDPRFFVIPDINSELIELKRQNLNPEQFDSQRDNLIREYSIKSERIHSVSQLLKAYTLFEKEVEYVIMENKIKIVDEQTGRIMEGRRYSDGLHQAIEAKENVTVEAATQTYATITLQNYFRMYHKLAGMTGTAETESKEFWDIYKLDVVVIPTNRGISRTDKNDMVYRSAREKYNAVINEVETLRNAGRPILVGTTTVEISELLSRMLKMKNIPHQVLNAKLHQKEAEIVAEAGKAGTVTIATNMAGRGTDIKLGEGVKEAGGLAIIGTERHDSRRVDRQLRGRSGRQGDPGSSQFFVSLEDDLMRKFGSERVAKAMDRMGVPEGEVISSRIITRTIERNQKKVEENNFGNRKHLLEYDDVMNSQRKAIYSKRKNALNGDRLDLDISNMFYDVIESIVNGHKNGSFESFELEIMRVVGIQAPFDENQFRSLSFDDLVNSIYDELMKNYRSKNERLSNMAYPQIKAVYENEKNRYINMQFPISDGIKDMGVIVNLEKAYNSEGAIISKTIEQNIVLQKIDDEWKEHLREMDDLRSAVRNAQYEQKDPLLIYKLESFELFKSLMQRLSLETVEYMIKADFPGQAETTNKQVESAYRNAQELQAPTNGGQQYTSTSTSNQQVNEQVLEREKQQPVIAEEKINRNDACPCGSGKKYKQCHGQ